MKKTWRSCKRFCLVGWWMIFFFALAPMHKNVSSTNNKRPKAARPFFFWLRYPRGSRITLLYSLSRRICPRSLLAPRLPHSPFGGVFIWGGEGHTVGPEATTHRTRATTTAAAPCAADTTPNPASWGAVVVAAWAALLRQNGNG